MGQREKPRSENKTICGLNCNRRLQVDTFDEAVAIENANPYGNAAAIYTMSGQTALETARSLFCFIHLL